MRRNATGSSILSMIGKAYSPNKIRAHRLINPPIVDDGSINNRSTTKKPIPHHQISDPNSCVTRGFFEADFLKTKPLFSGILTFFDFHKTI
jgi:hypothetical protein